MKNKGIVWGLFLFLAVVLCPQDVFADTSMSKMDYYVTLNEDGSASIKQYISTYADEGSEFSFLFSANDSYVFDNLHVTDKNGSYELVDKWEDSDSIKKKANKCAIVDLEDSYRIVFGISEYGVNQYIVSYDIKGFVVSYEDADGILFRFVNSDMSKYFPTAASVYISLADGRALTRFNSTVELFGYEGYAGPDDNGTIVAKTTTDVFEDATMTLMIRFKKGLFDDSLLVSHEESKFDDFDTFAKADGEYLNSYFNDYYVDDPMGAWYVSMMLIIVAIVVFGGISLFNALRNKKLRDFIKDAEPVDVIPNQGNINATYVLCKQAGLCDEGALLGTKILGLLKEGAVMADISDANSDKLRLELYPDVVVSDEYEKKLFDILVEAADGDNIVHPREMKRFGEEYFEKIQEFLAECENHGIDYLKERGIIKRSVYIGMESLTAKGKREFAGVCGFHKYLRDYARLERFYMQNKMKWRDNLSYAVLFNLVDEYSRGLKKEFANDGYYDGVIKEALEYAMFAYRYYGQVKSAMEDGSLKILGNGDMPE